MNKYSNQRIVVRGEKFDSEKEYERYCQLKILERAGRISNLQRQVKFTLIPTQREESREIYKKGMMKGQPKPGKLIEKECNYIADFVYFDFDKNDIVVEDVKGFRTKEYLIKRKLMLFVKGIRISEV